MTALPMIVHRRIKPRPVPRPKVILPTPEELAECIDRAAIIYGVDPAVVMSATRKQPIVFARQYVLATLTRKHKMPLSTAAKYFGYDRDTIRNALKQDLLRAVSHDLAARGIL